MRAVLVIALLQLLPLTNLDRKSEGDTVRELGVFFCFIAVLVVSFAAFVGNSLPMFRPT